MKNVSNQASQKETKEIKPWFELGFDEVIKATIDKHWPINATLICHDEAHRWAKMLLDINPDCIVVLNDGMFDVGGNFHNSCGHTWLEVNGYIFDPTAAQYDGVIDRRYYAAHDYCDGIDLVQRLNWWFENSVSSRAGMFDTADNAPAADENQLETERKHDDPARFNYQLLGRLQQDCDYYLGNGHRAIKHLWAGDESEQIKKMKELYEELPEKPEWITLDAIEQYESAMIGKCIVKKE